MAVGNRKSTGTGKRGKKETAKQAVTDQQKQLREKAGQVLTVFSKEMTESLGKNASRGHVPSARLLLELAAKQSGVKDERVKRKLYSLAAELAAEPEWDGEIHAVAAETMTVAAMGGASLRLL